jgi:cytidylate kinase
VVAPDADVRVLLTASVEARLRRRSKELHGHDADHAVEATRDQIVRRDRDDSTVSDFMEAAEGVTLVDTSDLDFEQSVQALLTVIRSQAPTKVGA